ncbi:MAG: endolytic transglycosylase MltG [Bacteroidales bacterium]|nr:endolytic transglycosylase MltG [Bacteroidales bacterium]
MTTTKPKKKKQAKKTDGGATTRHGLTFAYAIAITAVIIIAAGWCVCTYLFTPYDGETRWLYIPMGSDKEQVADSLATLDPTFGSRVMGILTVAPSTNLNNSGGAYKVEKGTTAINLARRMRRGAQTPVRVTFNNIRTMEQLADRLSAQMEMSDTDFLAAADTILPALGYSKPEFPAAFFPDTYEFYWNDYPSRVFKKLVKVHDSFWTEERLAKASALNLTPSQVATVASIVEEETAKSSERPLVARLYLNRLAKGMPLQADPTVKFATGNFSLRRINKTHLATKSPYNTYLHKGLPPGPIRIVDRQTIDDVLNAPNHNYLYMCAKEDFSGFHNFASDFATHQANARRYQTALNNRGIH